MGLAPFRFLMNDPRFVKIPKFLETPKGDDDEMDAVNLKVLRDLVESRRTHGKQSKRGSPDPSVLPCCRRQP